MRCAPRNRTQNARFVVICTGFALALRVMLHQPAHAQDSAVVAVDDSPTAEQLLAQADDQASNNPEEAARLIARVLDEFGRKLVRVPGSTDRFVDGRARAESFLRDHPGVLERFRTAQSGDAERIASVGDDRRVVETRLWTAAGLHASVREAERAVSAGQFARARGLLDAIASHPDLPTIDRAIRSNLLVLTAWGMRDTVTLGQLLNELATAQDPTLRALGASLDLIVGTPSGTEPTSVNPLAPAPFGPIPIHPVRLWRESLGNTLSARLQSSIDEGIIPSIGSEGSTSSGRLLVAIPTVDGDTILVNEGYVLRAYDAYSHLPKWTQFLGAANSPRSDVQAGDLAIVVVGPDCVLTLSGHALGTERSGGGRLACFDSETGQRRWDFAPDRFGDQSELRELFLFGSPIIVGEMVVVLARKVTPRLETVSAVLGLNLMSGAMQWMTPVGAAPGIRTAGSRPYTSPCAGNGCVFVSTGAGTTASIDVIDGRVRWIRRDAVPIRDVQPDIMPWEMGGAVLTTHGLITLAPDGSHVQVLATENGDERDAIPVGVGTAWGVPRYFLTSRDRTLVYGVGDGITAFRVTDLRTPLWRFTGSQRAQTLLATDGRAGIRGRVQSGWFDNGRAALIVPLLSDALFVDGETGATTAEIPCPGPANIVARDGVIVAATSDALEVLMDATNAERILVDAIRSRPNDADAVIGLVEFALHSHDASLLKSATQSVEAALTQVRDDTERRAIFVALLVEAAESGMLGREGSDELFEVIVRAPASATERATALIAQGDWFARSSRAVQAIATWRRLLEDAQASHAMISDAPEQGPVLSRSGAGAALLRLELIAATPDAPAAATQTSQGAPPAGATALALESFAASEPCTPSAARAWLSAAKLRMHDHLAEAAGDCVAALDAAIACGNRSLVEEILTGAIALLNTADLEISVAQLLDRALMAQCDPAVGALGGRLASVALCESPASSMVAGLPRPVAASQFNGSEDVITARLLRGALAPVRDLSLVAAPHSHAYLVADGTLNCVSIPDLAPRWKVPFRGETSAIIPVRDGVMVIEQSDRETLSVQWIDDTGESRWHLDDLAAKVSQLNQPIERAECLVAVGGEDLVVVRVDGAACAINSKDGQPRWKSLPAVDEVASIAASETMVVIAGTRSATDGRSSWITALDQRTGKVIGEFRVPSDEPVRWVRVISPAEVAFGTTRGVGRWQVFGSASGVRWHSLDPRIRATVHGEPLGAKLLLTDAADRSHILDWRSGSIEDAHFGFTPARSESETSRQWFRSGSCTVAWSRNGLEMFSLQGDLLGASRLHGARTIQGVAPTSGALVAVEQTGGADEPREVGLGRAAMRILIHRFGWSDGGRVASPALEVEFSDGRLDRIQVLDGWILLGGSQSTLAIPMP